MIIGTGVDIVDVERFKWMIRRSPTVVSKLFTDAEQLTTAGGPRSAESLAARFAAKEAVAKALGCPPGLNWQDCEVTSAPTGGPALRISGTVKAAATEQGIKSWHLTISHDGNMSIASVIAEGP